ncbi:LacI family transcriptional regulator [Salmonella enterica]|uniref:LacI family transcriptional regulator n=1 Tax=Salmonella enterica TaxID=28901 RepID=A0A379QLQ0_SALER|nr:LacI family transcriptional regulator [Salmonella enterica]
MLQPHAPIGSLLLHGRLAVRELVRRVGHTVVTGEGLYDSQTSIPNARLP